MQLVYIYGPPGVGKVTVAQELAALTGFKLFHNHLAVNLAASIFAHQSEPYFRLIRQIWRDTFTEVVHQDVDLICTAVYRGRPEHDGFIRWMLEPIHAGGSVVAYVRLTCARDEWLQRLQSESRHALNKLVDPQAALALADQVDLFATVPFEPALCINNTSLLPSTVARQITDYFSLPTNGRTDIGQSGSAPRRPRTRPGGSPMARPVPRSTSVSVDSGPAHAAHPLQV